MIQTLIILIFTATLSQIATDIYTPSIPAISVSLQSTLGQSQMTMALYVTGLALTTLIYGPLSEIKGRRALIIFGTTLGLLGMILCFFAKDILTLQLGRLLTGCGLGAATSLWRSLFRDHFNTDQMAKYNGMVLNAFVFSIVFAPFVGGYLQHFFGWRSNFLFLSIWTSCILTAMLFTLKDAEHLSFNKTFSISNLLHTYQTLLKNPTFVSGTLTSFFANGALFSWLTVGSSILVHDLNMTELHYGATMAVMGLSLLVANGLNHKLGKKISYKARIQLGGGILLSMSLLMLGLCTYLPLHPWMIISPMFIILIGTTLIFMNSFILGFSNIQQEAGVGAGLYSFFQILGAVITGTTISHLNTHSPIPMAIMIAICGALCIGIAWYTQRCKKI